MKINFAYWMFVVLGITVNAAVFADAEKPGTAPTTQADVATVLDSGTTTLAEIGPLIRPGIWARVTSAHAKLGKPEPEQEQNRAFIQRSRQLLTKMADYEKQADDRDPEHAKAAVLLYLTLADHLNESGGYINALLADSAKRLGVAHLIRLAVLHPEQLKVVQQLDKKVSGSPLSVRILAGVVRDETAHRDPSTAIEGKTGPEAAARLLEVLGSSVDQVSMVDPKYQQIGWLIDDVNVDILIGRAIYTDYVAQNLLPALIVFLNRGGKIQTVLGDDAAEFDRVMGKDSPAFGSKVLGIPRVSERQLNGLVKDITSPHPKIIEEAVK